MTHFPPPAEELRLIDAELGRLDARRAQLLTRRAWLVAALRQPVPVFAPAPPRPEASAPRVQNVLLLLGGVLLTIAAMAFTLVGWGQLGIAGRSVVLGAVTLAVLAAPVALLRRGLGATAESVAGLGLALTVLDAYALREVAWPGADGTGYAAGATAVLAAVWAGYGRLVATLPGGAGVSPSGGAGVGGSPAGGTGAEVSPVGGTGVSPAGGAGVGVAVREVGARLRLPLPAALAVAQLPLLLGAVAVGAGPFTVASVLWVTAVLDTVVAFRCAGGAVRVLALVGAYGMGGWATLAAAWFSWSATGLGDGVRAAVLLAALAALALEVSRRLSDPDHATAHAVAGGLLVVASLGTVPHALLPAGWFVPVHLALGVGLLAAVRSGSAAPVRRGLVGASMGVQGLALVSVLPFVTVSLTGPVSWVGRVWSGAPEDGRALVTAGGFWPAHGWTAPLVLTAVAAVLVGAVRAPDWRDRARAGALALVWTMLLVLPAVLELPYAATLSVRFGTAAALLLVVRTGLPGLVLGLVTSVVTVCSALATRSATLAVLSALVLLCAGASRFPERRVWAAPAGLGYAAGLAVAVGAVEGWAPEQTALPVLLVAAVAALLAARLGGTAPATLAVEAAGAAAALLAVGLAAPEPSMLALVLGLCGVIAAGTAARADRGPVGWAATVLFVLAAWVRLAAWGVGAPEAYTLPVTVPALLVGAVRRRRAPAEGVTSWAAYGPGLAVTLLPSLAAAWGDARVTRPLLLGAAALLLTLLGARYRLRAPLLLGGAVLVLVALHELAPYLVQLTGALPRWAPPALAGALLLAVGATYERRLRDIRRVREVLGRLR